MAPRILWKNETYRLVDIGGGQPPVLEQNEGIDAMHDPIWRPVKFGQPVSAKKASSPKAKTARKARPTNNGVTLREAILGAIRASGDKALEVKDLMPGLSKFAKQSIYAEITRLNKAGAIIHPATGIGWILNSQPAGEKPEQREAV